MTSKQAKLTILTLLLVFNSFAQELTQTVRGKILDVDSKTQLIGAAVVIKNSSSSLSTITDIDGSFSIENVPVGKVSLVVTYIGYEPQVLDNIVVETGKQTYVEIELQESFEKLDAVIVSDEREAKDAVNNEMAIVSSKSFTVEETSRYAGALNDPARMVSAFAGVSSDAQGNNDIIVRGNSPRGILWRLEGIEIPNPNHFSNEGATGGPVNTLNPALLTNSDFFTGAFAPEYGNALSGVFDIKYRIGNTEKPEQSFSIGALGTDITLEGPFNKDYNGSYLINYRYSTLDLLEATGVTDFDGVPKYQDGSFKINLPTNNFGHFTLFGLYGQSTISIEETEDNEDEVLGKGIAGGNLSVTALKHNYFLNEKSYIQSYAIYSTTKNDFEYEFLDRNTNSFYRAYFDEFKENEFRLSTSYNSKIDNRNTINTGIIYSLLGYDFNAKENRLNTQELDLIKDDGNTASLQFYGSWKYRLTKDLTMVSGLHYTQLMLNNNFSVDPRIAVKWQYNNKNYLSFGFGLHSKIETLSTYIGSSNSGSAFEYNNENLELSKATHYVVGYGHQFTENLFFKTEIYYQNLFDVPIENINGSQYSIINSSEGYINRPLVNEGTGTNYGIEFTLERYLANDYYFLFSNSIYESKYKAIDNIERDTKYNGNYTSNFLVGKEFQLRSKKNKNKTISLNLKATLLGGGKYSKIDLASSIAAKDEIYFDDRILTEDSDDVFFVNLGMIYSINRPKATHQLKLEIKNITNNQATVSEYYNIELEKIEQSPQLGLLPNILYTIKF